MIPNLVQADGSDLESEDDDPQQTQDQRTVPVHHVLWTNQIHSNLTVRFDMNVQNTIVIDGFYQ